MEEGTEKRSIQEIVLYLFTFVVSLLYITIGIVFLSSDHLLSDRPVWIKSTAGIMLIIYGAFRMYRLIRKIKNEEV